MTNINHTRRSLEELADLTTTHSRFVEQGNQVKR
jgi:hypothetical protein